MHSTKGNPLETAMLNCFAFLSPYLIIERYLINIATSNSTDLKLSFFYPHSPSL